MSGLSMRFWSRKRGANVPVASEQAGAEDKRSLEELLAAGLVRSALLTKTPLSARETSLVRQAYAAGLEHGRLAPAVATSGSEADPDV